MKPYLELEGDGSNVGPWIKMLDTQALNKRCHMALYKDYPKTTVDVAATALLMASLPKHFQRAIATCSTAHQAFFFIRKFIGGENQEANLVWQRQREMV